uniref:Uncharacterized protein n=1 Tax=Arundo donax TaxID=35708 RepID=A0A0A9DI33_ARUDO
MLPTEYMIEHWLTVGQMVDAHVGKHKRDLSFSSVSLNCSESDKFVFFSFCFVLSIYLHLNHFWRQHLVLNYDGIR